MKNDINLIGGHDNPVKAKQDIFLIVSLGLFAAIFLIAVLILSYSFIQKSRVSSLNATVNNLKARMSLLSGEKDKILTTSNRLSAIKKIIGSRRPLDIKMQSIISFIPEKFVVNNFSASDTEISMSLASNSLADFDNLLEVKIPQLTKNKAIGVNHIDIGSFAADQGNYSLLVTFYFVPSQQ